LADIQKIRNSNRWELVLHSRDQISWSSEGQTTWEKSIRVDWWKENKSQNVNSQILSSFPNFGDSIFIQKPGDSELFSHFLITAIKLYF
jgi:hypothetical protein